MRWGIQNSVGVRLTGVALCVGLAAALWWPARLGAQTLQTIAGGRTNVYGPDYGFADGDSTYESQFHTPMGCVVDAGTNLLVADYANGAIRKLNFVLNTTTTIITNLNGPVALARDRTNNLYVLIQGNINGADGTVLKYDWSDTSHRRPQTVVSNLQSPTALALEAETNLYITELGGSVKRLRVTGGPPTEVCSGLSNLLGVAVLNNGLLAVSQSGSNVVCLIDPATQTVTKQIGAGIAGFADGSSDVAQFNQPQQLAKAPNGTLVVADRFNHRVRLITTNGLVSTLYGVDSNLWVGPCLTCNPIILPGWYDGVNGGVSTAEAREPVGVTVDKDGTAYTTEDYYHIVRRVTNTGLGGTGDGEGTNIVAKAPVVEPLTGYYPMGVDIQVVNPNSDPVLTNQVFYTTDGSEPGADNPASQLLAMTNNVGVIAWRETTRDLSSLRVKAFLGSVGSPTVSGQPAAANQVGVAGDLTAGIGATVVMPVVAMLKPSQTLRSLEFLVEIAPLGNAKPLTAPVRALAMSPNDFVALSAASTNAPLTRTNTVGVTNQLLVAFIGTNAAFSVQGSAAVALLALTTPTDAQPNDRYQVAVRSPSGTADGVAQDVPLTSLPPRLITVTNQSYLVGDVAPATWYNAGGFGDGLLKNSDVNSALYASLGVRLPFAFTDAFDAMDAFPLDTTNRVGGDGQIRFLDWEITLERSLGLRSDRWWRTRGEDGARRATNAAPAAGKSGLRGAAATSATAPAPPVWNRQVKVTAGTVEYALSANDVRVPIYVNVVAGANLAGLQLWPVLSTRPDAADSELPSQFETNSVAGIPEPAATYLPGYPTNNVAYVWYCGAFNPPLEGSNLLGWLRFRVPAGTDGQRYIVRFTNADGMPVEYIQYDFETVPGSVWVNCAALLPPERISDEWKMSFFGSLTAAAAQAGADPDNDGLSNLAEYLRNTNPTVPDWRIGARLEKSNVVVSWYGEQGKRYEVLCSADLSAWRSLSPALPGSDQMQEFTDASPAPLARFYRVRILP